MLSQKIPKLHLTHYLINFQRSYNFLESVHTNTPVQNVEHRLPILNSITIPNGCTNKIHYSSVAARATLHAVWASAGELVQSHATVRSHLAS